MHWPNSVGRLYDFRSIAEIVDEEYGGNWGLYYRTRRARQASYRYIERQHNCRNRLIAPHPMTKRMRSALRACAHPYRKCYC